jgi:hypothetical protein
MQRSPEKNGAPPATEAPNDFNQSNEDTLLDLQAQHLRDLVPLSPDFALTVAALIFGEAR